MDNIYTAAIIASFWHFLANYSALLAVIITISRHKGSFM